jgi:hypothetical protein
MTHTNAFAIALRLSELSTDYWHARFAVEFAVSYRRGRLGNWAVLSAAWDAEATGCLDV